MSVFYLWRVAPEKERVVAIHPTTIIDTRTSEMPPRRIIISMPCARIDAVFHEFLLRPRPALDDFSGGDLIGDDFREEVNAGHFNQGQRVTVGADLAPRATGV